MIPNPVRAWLTEHGAGQIIEIREVGGGCINHGRMIKTDSQQTFFVKTNSQTPADMFEREAEGLLALQIRGAPRVPLPYQAGRDYLILEYLAPAERQPDYWSVFGRQLALLHLTTSPSFGFNHDNYIGSTPQSNTWGENGFEFYAQQRLLFQARLANQHGLLTSREVQQVEGLASRLAEFIPEQPASLIHGDLWSGNLIVDSAGMPVLIDPAVYFGWAEAELAMTDLFGGFPKIFYHAYEQVRPLEPGYWERFPIYNLYHLINHLNLFGTGYRAQVLNTLARYSS